MPSTQLSAELEQAKQRIQDLEEENARLKQQQEVSTRLMRKMQVALDTLERTSDASLRLVEMYQKRYQVASTRDQDWGMRSIDLESIPPQFESVLLAQSKNEHPNTRDVDSLRKVEKLTEALKQRELVVEDLRDRVARKNDRLDQVEGELYLSRQSIGQTRRNVSSCTQYLESSYENVCQMRQALAFLKDIGVRSGHAMRILLEEAFEEGRYRLYKKRISDFLHVGQYWTCRSSYIVVDFVKDRPYLVTDLMYEKREISPDAQGDDASLYGVEKELGVPPGLMQREATHVQLSDDSNQRRWVPIQTFAGYEETREANSAVVKEITPNFELHYTDHDYVAYMFEEALGVLQANLAGTCSQLQALAKKVYPNKNNTHMRELASAFRDLASMEHEEFGKWHNSYNPDGKKLEWRAVWK